MVLVTCISNIDYLEAGNQPIMQKWSIAGGVFYKCMMLLDMNNDFQVDIFRIRTQKIKDGNILVSQTDQQSPY